MNINKNIIDQRIAKIIAENPAYFSASEVATNEDKKNTQAFTMLGIASYLDTELDKAFDMLTDAGNDMGIDAIYIGDTTDIDFNVIIFQSKYTKKLDTDSNFSENAIVKVIYALDLIFDRSHDVTVNDKLKRKVAEIQDLAYNSALIPQVKCVMLSNGIKWNSIAQQKIDIYKKDNPYVEFDFFNHDNILDYIQSYKNIKADLRLSGKAYTETLPNFKRVLIGKINVMEVAKLFEKHKDNLLERNIRKFLGVSRNRINAHIKETLLSENRENFYLYNNGITMICSKFRENGFAHDWVVKVEDLQIINGGQTCKTIQQTVEENQHIDFSDAYVMIRLYEIDITEQQVIVDLRDLKANDAIQKNLEIAVADLGYTYKRKKDNVLQQIDGIASSAGAEAVLTIWRECPHIAKYKREDLFGKFYDKIFQDLTASQLIIAVLVFRYCDNQRRREDLILQYPHLPYSNYFMAMLMGKLLLKENRIQLPQLTHKNFEVVKVYFEQHKEFLFQKSNQIISETIKENYNMSDANVELRKLSATFRRNELIQEVLQKI